MIAKITDLPQASVISKSSNVFSSGSGDEVNQSIFSKSESKDDKLKKAKAEALGGLIDEVEIKPEGKPVAPQFNDILQSAITKLQQVTNSYSDKVAKLQCDLDPNSPNYKQKLAQVKNEIKKLKDEAKAELNRIYACIVAMEQVTAILIAEYGLEKAKTLDISDIKGEIQGILSTNEQNPKKIMKHAQDLIEKFKKKEEENKAKRGINTASLNSDNGQCSNFAINEKSGGTEKDSSSDAMSVNSSLNLKRSFSALG